MVAIEEFPISSANIIPGYKIVDTKGFVYGLTVGSRGIGGNVLAGLRTIKGGEIHEYIEMMENSRNEALNRCIEHAKELGANAIISVRFDSNEIGESMQEILVYGTAVILENE